MLVGAIAFALGFLLAEAAARRADARLVLVAMAFLATSGFLVLHAFATPGVLLAGKNAGFQVASAIGLFEAGLLMATSAVRFHPETAALIVRYRGILYLLLALHMGAWAAVSLTTLPPLDDPVTPEDTRWPLAALAFAGLLAYAFGAWRYGRLYRQRPRPLPLAVLIALILLTEAMFTVAFARNWRTTWWEWHLLMLSAFVLVALAARREWRLEGSSAEIFSDIYEEQTRGHLEEVSVLFADLQGYTAYAERTPEPEVKAMLDTYFPAAAPALQAHDGEIYSTIGDAFMVVFRGPGHELRAARTGLEFQREMSRIAGEHPGWPRFRAGINSGEAVLGVVDAPGSRGYTATGDTVNVASRLEGHARAGEVVVSEPTHAGLRGRARAEELEPLSVKGKRAPVRAFVLHDLDA
ncbi:MAG TPA: adenylate/guanylate cyclase domain-containing protein [Gaiellaceae bacterium]|nr:adenylate/guanylate cyclase domain-containing protein [Gaiellaceae bacterium]